jgi:glycosyltransferase involved in cell wall biosynthesis
MEYTGQKKRPRVVTVARWHREDWRQKNPQLLLKTLVLVLQKNPEVVCQVVGRMEEEIKAHFLKMAGNHRNRLILSGRIPNPDLAPILQSAQISLCSSNHESFHIASAEALCCGCSVVAPDLPELPSLHWFAGESCGQLAEKSPERLAQAVTNELRLWRDHQRDAGRIAKLWGARLHADRVAARILHLMIPVHALPPVSKALRP